MAHSGDGYYVVQQVGTASMLGDGIATEANVLLGMHCRSQQVISEKPMQRKGTRDGNQDLGCANGSGL